MVEILHIEDKNILQLRKVIKETLIENQEIYDINGINSVTVEAIEELIRLYDFYVLDDYVKNNIEDGIKVSLSNRMTSAGGKTIFYKKRNTKDFEIRISLVILQAYIDSSYKGKICGIEGNDVIDGLMLIMEHELCHVLEFSAYGTSNCKGRRFKAMAWKLFRHGASTHEVTSNKGLKEGATIMIGQEVTFMYKGNAYSGVVANINKRATVMVKDPKGQYKDKKGNTFNKWYVPLTMLKGEGKQ